MRVAVLITCFNRKATTLRGLSALRASLDNVPGVTYSIFLVDDASTDGTGQAVSSEHPDVNVIQGTGSLFWNGGMCHAYEAARASGPFDAYLLFNDDVATEAEGVKAFFADYLSANSKAPSILVGSTTSSEGSKITYSGFRRIPTIWRPRASVRVVPDGTFRDIDMPNGNFVLVPAPFFESIGGLDPGYVHNFGDVDLGLVAKKHGVNVFLAPSTVGVCDNKPAYFRAFCEANLAKRWRMLKHPLTQPCDYSHFVWKHSPRFLYPLYMLVFHLKRFKSLFFPREGQ